MKKILTWLLLPYVLCSQSFWERTEPYAGTLNKMYFGNGDTVYGTLNSGFTRSTNRGTTWSTPVIVSYVTDMAISPNGNIFLSQNQYKISRSTNKGASWTVVGTGINESSCGGVLVTAQGTVLAGTASGIYRSTNNGNNWTKVAGAAHMGADTTIAAFASYDGIALFALSRSNQTYPEKGYVFRSTDDGVTWIKGASSLDSVIIYKAVATADGKIIARTNNAVRVTTDGGNSWSAMGFYGKYISDVAIAQNGHVYVVLNSDDDNVVYKTTNNGISWLPMVTPYNNAGSIHVASNGDIFLGQDQLYRSTDNGTTWQALPLGYPTITLMQESPKHDLYFSVGGFAYQVLYRSTDFGLTWKPLKTGVVGIPVAGFFGDTIFVGDNYYPAKVYRSTDNGATFKSLSNNIGLGGYVNAILGTSFNTLLMATSNGIYRSVNPTKNWEKVFSTGIHSLKQSPNGMLFARREWSGDGIYRSIDSGTTWEKKMDGIPFTVVRSFDIAPNGDIVVGTENGIFRSTTNADSWVRIDTQKTIKPVFGVFVTINKEGKIFVGGSNNSSDYGVYYSENNGVSWTYIQNGYTSIDNQAKLQSLFVASDGHLFAGTSAGLFRSLQKTTSVKQVHAAELSNFRLEQNYPNPFNPSTMIRYQVPVYSHVSLKLYDAIGREIASLVNERQLAGNYEVPFDGKNLSSGVYFYKLQAEGFVQTRKMMLTK